MVMKHARRLAATSLKEKKSLAAASDGTPLITISVNFTGRVDNG